MKRSNSTERLQALVEAAIEVFQEKGYRRTQMADIARTLGVASGTAYLYVESKEALFALALQYAMGVNWEEPLQLPIKNISQDAILLQVQEAFVVEPPTTLAAALQGAEPDDIQAEVRAVASELFHRISKRRRAIRLVERSADDWPELAALYYKSIRRSIITQLQSYLDLRSRQGKFYPVPDAPTAARLFLETTAWFALHRHGDPDSAMITDEMAHETVVTVLSRAFVPTIK